MTILDRYLLRRMIATFLKTAFSLVFLFVLIDFLTHRRTDVMQQDVPWGIVVQYYLTYIPHILSDYQVAAMALLVSALLVLGQAAQNNEVIAAMAGGISLRRLVRMPVLVAAAVTVGVLIMNETFGPAATRQAYAIEDQYFSMASLYGRPPVSWANLSGGWTCHILKFNRLALTGENVLMNISRGDAVEQIRADRIYWDPDRQQWILEDGRWFAFEPDWQLRVDRITQVAAPLEESPGELLALEQPVSTKSARTLARDIHMAERRGLPTQRLWVDFHAKLSQSFLAFVMIWLAVPFALRLRKGGLAIGFGASLAIGLAYIITFRVGTGMGHMEQWPPLLAAWFANGVFFITGATLFYRTGT